MLLAEANQWPEDVRHYFGAGDECHMAFHFPLMPRIFMALRLEDAEPIIEIMRRTPPIPEPCQWGLFLRNHDELTLEMVTNDERDYMYLAYSQDPRMKLNVGIRRRLGPLDGQLAAPDGAAQLAPLLVPGHADRLLRRRDWDGRQHLPPRPERRPDADAVEPGPERRASPAPTRPGSSAPPISDPVYGYQAVNVEGQLRDPSSLLHWMRNTIALRKLFKAFGRGTMEFLPVANRKVLAYVRRHEEDVLLCVANVSRFAQPAELDLSQFAGAVPVEILGYTEFPRIGRLPYFLTPRRRTASTGSR